jgi:hypothetical protein
MLSWKFSEDELNNFYVTFMNIIKNYTLITNETRATGNNPIYEKVIDYYRNFKSDNGSTAIALILKSLQICSRIIFSCNGVNIASYISLSNSCRVADFNRFLACFES